MVHDVRALLLKNHEKGKFFEETSFDVDIIRLWDEKVNEVQSGVSYVARGDGWGTARRARCARRSGGPLRGTLKTE
jgi:hypothetical protein